MKPVQFAGIHYVNLYRGPALKPGESSTLLQPLVDELEKQGFTRRTSTYNPEGKHYYFVAAPYNDEMPQSIASDSTFLVIDNGLGENEGDTALAKLVMRTVTEIHPNPPHAQKVDQIFTQGNVTGSWYRAVGKNLGFSYVCNFQDHPEDDNLPDRLAFRLAGYEYQVVPLGVIVQRVLQKIRQAFTG